MKLIPAGLCALMLTACSPQAPLPSAPEKTPAPTATAEVFTFVCAGGRSFDVTYDEGFTVATVSMEGATYKLPAAISASGARYFDGKVEFWEHHGEAMLSGFPGSPEAPCPLRPAD